MSAPSVAYFRGDDLFGLDAAATKVGREVAGSGEPLETWRVSGAANSASEIATRIASIEERVGTAPLFGGGTLVVVSDPGPLAKSKEDREALIGVLRAVAPGNALVFLESTDGSKRPASAALTALRSAVEAAGGRSGDLSAPTPGQLAGWIEAQARERSIVLGRGAAAALAARIGGLVKEGDVDRRRLGQVAVGELEKLGLYRPNGEILVADVEALVPEAVPGSAWAFLDAVAERRARAALDLVDRLLASTPEPVIVAQLHRRLRELAEAADRLERGEIPGSLARTMKLHSYRAERLSEAARQWRSAELAGALEGLFELDVALKGAEGGVTTPNQRTLAFTLWILDRVAPRR